MKSLLSVVLALLAACAAAQPVTPWDEKAGVYSVPAVELRLDHASSYTVTVAQFQARYLVPNFYFRAPAVVDEFLLKQRRRDDVTGSDADVHLDLRDAKGEMILSEGAVLQRWGWGGTLGEQEIRVHKVLDLASFSAPFTLVVSVHTPSSRRGDVRFELTATRFVID